MDNPKYSRQAEAFEELSEDCSDNIDNKELRAFADLAEDKDTAKRPGLHQPSLTGFGLILGMLLIGVFFGFLTSPNGNRVTSGMVIANLPSISQIQLGIGLLTAGVLVSSGLFWLLLKVMR